MVTRVIYWSHTGLRSHSGHIGHACQPEVIPAGNRSQRSSAGYTGVANWLDMLRKATHKVMQGHTRGTGASLGSHGSNTGIGVARVLRLGGKCKACVNLTPVKNGKLIGFGPLF